MKYGYFDNENLEYVITNPKTPVKWVNYIGGLSFGGLVDQTGGAIICKGDPALNRIVKYIPQLPNSEFKGETLYLRLKTDSGYKIFSPFFVPTLDPYDFYSCRVGNGYSIITSEMYGIKTEVTIFVPKDSKREIRDIKVTNLTGKVMEIDAIPLVEYTHFEAIKQFNNADWVPQTMQSEAYADVNGMTLVKQFAFMRKETKVNYFTSNQKMSSFETDRKIFLGDNGYGTYMKPLSLLKPELSNYEALREDNIIAALHHFGCVQPGETKRLITQLGQYENFTEELIEINQYRDEKVVDAAFIALRVSWANYLSQFQVNTPCEDMNTLLNIHNPKQCLTTMNWSRFLSLYQTGLADRGIGFRDTSQDLIGVMGICANETTDMISKLLSTQKIDGSAMHQFYPASMVANNGEAGHDERPDYYGDDHLWIILTVCEYLKETGDYDFLNTVVPYYDKDKLGQPMEHGTILEHLNRAIEFTQNNKGRHELPLLGYADWNDCVNLPKGAESNFNANLFGKGLLELKALMLFLGRADEAAVYEGYYTTMKEAFNKACWDGEWFIRYFDHEGEPIGSHINEQGKIYANGQSWSVLSQFASEVQARTAMDSLEKLLNTKHGIKLSAPGYNGFDPIKGGVSTYPPGAKENGGIFLHANPWAMIAETMLGDGNKAFKYYQQINPISKNEIIDEFEVEPYVYPQNILGNEHPQFGLGRNSWLSGTASWAYQAGTKYMLGIRADYNGLIIDPCIPNEWDGFSVKKVFRGATYHIDIQNPNHVSKGIVQMVVDGKVINGAKCPIFEDRRKHQVIAIMG
ncbi:MAG: glycosyl transferase [Vallitaleaceae bacterium]|nr:glycosyl transferase [Vallitaleaceae bacterium]